MLVYKRMITKNMSSVESNFFLPEFLGIVANCAKMSILVIEKYRKIKLNLDSIPKMNDGS